MKLKTIIKIQKLRTKITVQSESAQDDRHAMHRLVHDRLVNEITLGTINSGVSFLAIGQRVNVQDFKFGR